MVERLNAGLQEQVCPMFGPLHRLVFHKAFTEHVVNRRLHKRRRNRFSVPIPPAIVGNEATIVLDIRAELPHGSFEAGKARGCVRTRPNKKQGPAADSLNVPVYAVAKEVRRI